MINNQNKMAKIERQLVLEDVLNEKQILHILKQSVGDVPWELKATEIRPATDGIAGFLGEHKKAEIHINVEGEKKKVRLFIKQIPTCNKPKADFIDGNHYFKRERLMFELLEKICANGSNPWCVKAYLYTDSMIVMPDLTYEGYFPRHFLETLDLEHMLLTTTSIAQFHAAFVNYETEKSLKLKQPYTISQEFGHILTEPTFCDSPWLRVCPKVSVDLLKAFSKKPYRNLPDLESKLEDLYLEACDSLTEYEETVNVLIHKDLWVNNIMFKYENNIPTNAVIVDYQLLRYTPPAFDLMTFLYLTTDREFRQEHEKDVLDRYYFVFISSLSDKSRTRLDGLGYDRNNFLQWCEKARMFGMFDAVGTYPYVLMDPKSAQKAFDDPETYEKHLKENRSEPVLELCHRCETYKKRNLDVTEEFVETYVWNQI